VAKFKNIGSQELYVLKRISRPFTPYCGLKLVELAQGFFPPGVVQALSGLDELGPWMTSHPKIDKISFTGSTATGKRVMQSASATLKRLTLELYVCQNLY
jgi:acyl-CoA reductase-like NAD-dependent aldehyde dehydrogenase